MSVFEDLEELQKRVDARLQELEPLVAEYHRLQQLSQQLDFDLPAGGGSRAEPAPPERAARQPSKPAPAARKPAARRRRAPKRVKAAAKPADSRRRPGGTRETGRDRRERVLELIATRPGITVPEISRELGVDPPPLYRVVRKLLADGVVNKEGKSLQMA
jgi:hypothetical protein